MSRAKPVYTVVKLVRLTPDEAALLAETAARLGLSEAALLRLMIRNARFLTVSVPPIAAGARVE